MDSIRNVLSDRGSWCDIKYFYHVRKITHHAHATWSIRNTRDKSCNIQYRSTRFNNGSSKLIEDIPVKLPWIFPGAPLNFNGAPGNIQGNLRGMGGTYARAGALSRLVWKYERIWLPRIELEENVSISFESPLFGFVRLHWDEYAYMRTLVPESGISGRDK